MLMQADGSREQRRLAVKWEREAFRTGRWKPWERLAPSPAMVRSSGWCAEITEVARNWLYVVLIRPVSTPWGVVHHCAIRTASNLEPPWRDKQRIKDELFGPMFTAVEVMPPADELIDQADMYHIWVMPANFLLPFTLDDRKSVSEKRQHLSIKAAG